MDNLKLFFGDNRTILPKLKKDSVDCVLTSPPYWGLRDYGTGPDQLGLEPTWQLFIKHMVEISSLLKRVLKPTGSYYLVMGDTYQDKQLLGIPHELARELKKDGWTLRNKIIWYKPNHMPSSVKDRLTNSYEEIFHFVQQRKYYYDLDSIRVPHTVCGVTDKRPMGILRQKLYPGSKYHGADDPHLAQFQNKDEFQENIDKGIGPTDSRHRLYPIGRSCGENPKGKNPGDTTEVPYAVQPRQTDFTEYRNLPPMDKIRAYLNDARKNAGYTIDQVEDELESQAPHHWFNGESYPTADDWLRAKELLNFDDKYDQVMTEIFTKPSVKVNNPAGKNPGDTIQKWENPAGQSAPSFARKRHSGYYGEDGQLLVNPAGKNPSDFFKSNTKPYPEAHFAVFPEDICIPRIKSSTPKEVCVSCGKARERIIVGQMERKEKDWDKVKPSPRGIKGGSYGWQPDPYREERKRPMFEAKWRERVWTKCSCNKPFEPGVVLDPFAGSGTTLKVALDLGRKAIGIEINQDYRELIERRLSVHNPEWLEKYAIADAKDNGIIPLSEW